MAQDYNAGRLPEQQLYDHSILINPPGVENVFAPNAGILSVVQGSQYEPFQDDPSHDELSEHQFEVEVIPMRQVGQSV